MKTDINEKRGAYESFLKSHEKGHFMQSPEWAQVKSNWKNEVVVIEDKDGNIKGSMSMLIRKIPLFKYTIMYSPRGPVCDIHDKETFRALLDGAKQLAKKHNSYVLKIDPDVEKEDEQFGEIVRELGFNVKNASKNFEGIQPRFVFRLDIKDKTEEEVMTEFHNKTRYNIRLAERKGVVTSIGTKEDLREFHKVMRETGVRDEFVIRSLEYFEKMYDCLAPKHLRLYTAHYEGKLVAGTIAILYGNKVWYLYGASSNEYRNVMPNYLLQWEMIKWALENGCEIYDFRGVSGDLDESNPLYGLYKFKKGFNGKFTEFIGELDLIFNPLIHFSVEKGEKVFREMRRKVFMLKETIKGQKK
ncbi:MAG: lipid II:glycine glycyltransferase FemX [Clostridia bacterium]